MSSAEGRLIYDLSTVVRWTGPAVGIVRASRELAVWLRANRPEAAFVFFDPDSQTFRCINQVWIDPIINGEASINLVGTSDPRRRRRRSNLIPKALRPTLMWVLQLRRSLVFALERLRFSSTSPFIRRQLELIQWPLLSEKYRKVLFSPDGRRRTVVPPNSALGAELIFSRADTLVVTSAWGDFNIETVRALKAKSEFQLVMLCYDIIPLQFPQFYKAHDVSGFREHFHVAFAIADLTIVSAERIEADVRAYCEGNRIGLRQTAVVGLGAEVAAKSARSTPLPSGLATGRFALFVSTIEPRKGHGLLYRVWRKLLDAGVPQENDFKLVFVGRPGWLVNELLDQIRSDNALGNTLLMLPNANDETLATLYHDAAFCLYPSLYEGYGLPVAEAFSYGKAVISSNRGALPEVVGDFSPCLDPADEAAWYSTIKEWIIDPAARAPYEHALRTRYSPRTWKEAGSQFFQTVAAHGRSPAGACSSGPENAAAAQASAGSAGNARDTKNA